MMKRTKTGRWRKMTKMEGGAEQLAAEQAAVVDQFSKDQFSKEIPPEAQPYQFPGERTPLARIIDNLLNSHDLRDVLVGLRDKVQRLNDEMSGPSSKQGETREEIVRLLGRAIRHAHDLDSMHSLPMNRRLSDKLGITPPTESVRKSV